MDIYSIRKVKPGCALVEVPTYVLETLGVNEGEYIIFKGDKSSHEIVIKPLVTSGCKAAELKVLLKNIPGTNANVDTMLAKYDISIMFGKGGVVESDLYSSVKLIDITNCKLSLNELRKELELLPEVVDIAIEEV